MEIVQTDLGFDVDDDQSYSISIEIGSGQKGNSSFKNFDESYKCGEIDNVPLGKGAAIRGKYIQISSMVTDIRHDTNEVNISYLINGQLLEELNEETDEEHGSVFFKTKINFN